MSVVPAVGPGRPERQPWLPRLLLGGRVGRQRGRIYSAAHDGHEYHLHREQPWSGGAGYSQFTNGPGGVGGDVDGAAGTSTVGADIFPDSCAGSLTDDGYNADAGNGCPTTGTGDFSTFQSTDLGSLGNNGGPTQTIVPATSLAAAIR